MTKQYILLFYFVSLLGCTSEKKRGITEGTVFVSYIAYEPDITMNVGAKIFYKGNRSVQEVPELNIVRAPENKRTSSYRILHYTYLNKDSNYCGSYWNLSDTAKPFSQYSDVDSVKKTTGWNFYSDTEFKYDSLKPIGDTIMNDVQYRRVRVYKKVNNMLMYYHFFMECGVPDRPIRFYNSLSKKLGCPIVITETYTGGKLVGRSEIKYTSDTLTAKENNILEAWEKNRINRVK